MMRLAHSLFLLRFFGSARHVPNLSVWEEQRWHPALGESSSEAIYQFSEQGHLVSATLSYETAQTDIQCVWALSELKQMAIRRGLKRSGRKDDLAKALLAMDYEGVKLEYESLGLLEMSNLGRNLANLYQTTLAEYRDNALLLLSDGQYAAAVKIATEFEVLVGFPKGDFQINPGADDIRWIMTATPSILKGCSLSDLRILREYVALNGLGLPLSKTKQEMASQVAGTRFDFEVAARMLLFNSYQKRNIARARAAGLTQVEILVMGDNQCCGACREHSGKKFALDQVPDLPNANCTSICGCRCLTSAVIPESWLNPTAEDRAVLEKHGISVTVTRS